MAQRKTSSKSGSRSRVSSRGVKGAAAGLVALIGVTATAFLLESVPADESGRTVAAEVTAKGDVELKHIRGRQYLRAYLDIAGVATACDGITRGVKLGQRYTEAECTRLLIRELEIHARGAMRCAPSLMREGYDYQRIAVVSFTYNIGIGGFCGSSARRYFEAGNPTYACARLLPWNKARVRGRLTPVNGLTRRRNREYQLCLTNLKPGYTPANLNARLAPWV